MRKVKIDGFEYTMPEQFGELNINQQIEFALALRQEQNFDKVKTRIALSLLGLKVTKDNPIILHNGQWKKLDVENLPGDAMVYYYIVHESKRVHLLSALDILPLLAVVDGFFTIDKKRGTIAPKLESAEPMPFIRLGLAKMHSYQQGLTDFSFADFIDCETYLAQYYAGDEMAIYRFIARGYGRECERSTTDEKLEKLAKRIKKNISAAVADAIRLNYEGQKVFLYSKFDTVLQHSGGNGEAEIDAAEVFDGYCKLVATLGGGDPTKHADIKKTLLYEALYALEERMKQIEINSLRNAYSTF